MREFEVYSVLAWHGNQFAGIEKTFANKDDAVKYGCEMQEKSDTLAGGMVKYTIVESDLEYPNHKDIPKEESENYRLEIVHKRES